MKKRSFLIIAAFMAFIACNSVQKSVDPTGQGPVPQGSGRNIDEDTIKAPNSDTAGTGGAIPDSVKRED